jgi:hypothetical protein
VRWAGGRFGAESQGSGAGDFGSVVRVREEFTQRSQRKTTEVTESLLARLRL